MERVVRAADALAEYGQHKPACQLQRRPGTRCTCGLDAALAALRLAPAATPPSDAAIAEDSREEINALRAQLDALVATVDEYMTRLQAARALVQEGQGDLAQAYAVQGDLLTALHRAEIDLDEHNHRDGIDVTQTLAIVRAAIAKVHAPASAEQRGAAPDGATASTAGGAALDRLAWCIVSAAIEWQDAKRGNDGHLKDHAIELRLLDALNDYRYPATPPAAPGPGR